MNFSDALKSIIKPHDKDELTPLSTIWGENLDTSNVLPEYPRPQMRRERFISLNGYWDYAFTSSSELPDKYEGKILVPFSPEAALSGVNRQLKPDEFLWYRTFLPPITPPVKNTDSSRRRLLLHFGAVDYRAQVYINSQSVITHLGGYLPFCADITDYLMENENELIVKVQDTTEQDSQARGKQTLRRGGIFYTAQSGIWQSVWMEWVPASYVESLWFETDFDTHKVTAHINTITVGAPDILPPVSLSVFCKEKEIGQAQVSIQSANISQDKLLSSESAALNERKESQHFTTDISINIPEEFFHAWSPEDPFLYDVEITFGQDHIKSYFAMRCYTIEKSVEAPEGIPVFCLNHKPYFLMGVLDQGYWPDGLYTAPSEEALLYDITTMKSMGFNMLRKHIKVECARWYYHCDRLGMIVCQDMVNGGSCYHMPVISYLPTLCPSLAAHLKDSHYSMLSRKDENARRQWEKECMETVDSLKFFPSIAIWVPFNEGWGQFDTARITNLIKDADSSRLIDSASGWFDQNCGDFISVHNYFRPLSVSVKKWTNRAFFLSEYGGFACHIKGHSSVERIFGYKRYDTLSDFEKACGELIEKSLLPLRAQGLSGAVYTQLSDVEEEVNGLLTYDRKVNKLSGENPAPFHTSGIIRSSLRRT